MKKTLINQQQHYYSKDYVLFEIVKCLKNREFALLNSKKEEKHIATRFLYASNIKYLKMNLKELGVLRGEKLINLYRSNSTLLPNSIPVTTFNLQKRTKDKNYQEFNRDFQKYICGFDFIIDIDAETIRKSYHIAKKIKKFYDDNKLPYFIQFSGTRGFHIIIPQEFIKFDSIENLTLRLEKVLSAIQTTFNYEKEIDTSTLNPKGLIKIPYSFDSGNIALPLNDDEFNDFKEHYVSFNNVMKNITLKNRGLFLRTHGLTPEELIDNVTNFIE